MFENLILPQLGNNNVGGMSSARMHLFSPRLFSNQGKRPIAYKFDGEFVPAAIDAVSDKVSSMNGIKIETLTKNPNYMGAMVPTFRPDYMLDMSRLAHYWTFMLIVNNDKTGATGITRSMADNLHLYYGYFLEEPINPLHHLGRVSINENAALMITHKTIVNKSSHVSQMGPTTRVDTMADIDIIPSKTMAHLSSATTMPLRPEDIYNNVATSINGEVTVIQDDGQILSNMGSSLDINSNLSIPKNNIRKILDSIADAQGSVQADSFDGIKINLGNDSFSSLLGQNLSDRTRELDMGLSTNLIITMGTVMQKYNPTVIPINLPYVQPYDTFDQSHSSAKAVFSSMLSTILPAIMSNFVLAQISFRYNSYHDAMTIYTVATTVQMPEEEKRNRVNSFIFRLKSEIFPILKRQHGDFDLNMNCDCTSITHVNLHFLSDSQATNDYFEVPTLLGGFNSPLVGTANVSNANSHELGALINIISDNDRDTPLGHYDTASYNRSLLTYDTNIGTGRSMTPNIDAFDNHSHSPKDWCL